MRMVMMLGGLSGQAAIQLGLVKLSKRLPPLTQAIVWRMTRALAYVGRLTVRMSTCPASVKNCPLYHQFTMQVVGTDTSRVKMKHWRTITTKKAR